MNNKTDFFGKHIWLISCVALIGILMGTGYSYFKQELDFVGSAKIVKNSTTEPKVCSVMLEKSYTETINGETTTYNYSFKMTNQSDEPIYFWTAYFEVPDDAVVSVSGAEYEIQNGILYINSHEYNNYIDSGSSINFGVIITTSYEYTVENVQVQNCTLIESQDENNNLGVDISIQNGWGNYIYQYNIVVKNNGTTDLKAWEIYLQVPENISIIAIWSANYVLKDNTLIISNVGYNGGITVGNETSFGMQMEVSEKDFIPTVIKTLGR